ncbi:hypothetical protein BV898_00269 [Hypsibius exemplaris]|uniref:Ensconsin n=1 Tax=Hypsibius exemplaris TaxID=2072580 RepID=A0A1W0XF99_HYPEX|nr:hypothetical protein BV898_00269 [Hypsibius exemplaris]
MNLLYPEMDSPSGPSIMGSENPKLSERRSGTGQSDSDSTSEAHTPIEGMNASMIGGSSRKSRDGLSREERMKLVRERQMEEHKRRLDELRQAQIQAMKAKQQQDEERKRRLEEIKNRDESKRQAVEARRKRIEDEERERCDAIIRKHQEIFDRIDSKKRQHESRKMAYGLSTYQLADQDPVYTGQTPSRRAISASGLSRQRGNQTSRSHYHHQSTRFSPGRSAQSARIRPSPSTPSRNGGGGVGHFDSISGSKTTSLENSPAHTGRHPQHYRLAQSHPPPVTRYRMPPPEIVRSKTGSRPQTAQVDTTTTTQSARAKRPTSLMTRSNGPDLKQRQEKSTPATPEAFRTMSKRSQSVGNVSARNKVKPATRDTLKPASSQRDVTASTPRKEGVCFEENPDSRQSPEPGLTRTGRKVISEAEAKAALAEKRRQARLKVEFERAQQGENGNSQPTESTDSHPPSALGVESPPLRDADTPRRASEIEFLELERSFKDESRSFEDSDTSKIITIRGLSAMNESNPDNFSPMPEEETVGSGILRNGGGESPESTSDTIVRGAEVSEREPETLEVVVVREDQMVAVAELSPVVSVITEEPLVPEFAAPELKEKSPEQSPLLEESTTLVLDASPASVNLSPVDSIRAEAERRRLEIEQREEEERNARRARLEAIKRLTKGSADPAGSFTGSTERLASPATESAKPIDALENARKLLQRRGLGMAVNGSSEVSSLVSSPSMGSLKTSPVMGQAPDKSSNEAAASGSSEEGKMNGNAGEGARSATGTPFSEASSTDTVSLNGYIRSHDGEGQQNGFSKTIVRNGSISGMSETSSVDFEPYMPKSDWHHLNGSDDVLQADIWSGSNSNPVAQSVRTGIASGNTDLLLNFDDH